MSAKTTDKFTYVVYKVFDATATADEKGISYTKLDTETFPIVSDDNKAQFAIDGSNVVYQTRESATDAWETSEDTDISASLVKKMGKITDQFQKVGTVDITGANKTGYVKLDYGYYYVTTTTGSLVAISTNNSGATVGDKNSVPTVDKTITGVDDKKGSVNSEGKKAIAEVGSTVNYKSVISVGKGAANYTFKDKLDANLALNTGDGKFFVGYLNKDAKETDTPTILNAGTDYSLNTSPTDTAYTFSIQFNSTDAAKAALTEGNRIVITYSATVTSDALQSDPAKNTAWVSYGNDPSSTYDTVPSETKTYNAKISVVKRAENKTTGEYLPNAGFKLKKSNGDSAQYYKLNAAEAGTNKSITWGNADVATELFSGKDGKLYTTKVAYKDDNSTTAYKADENGEATDVLAVEASFTGLSDGTYYLEESTVPVGYNKASDAKVTVNDATISDAFTDNNLIRSETVVNNKGSVLPSTGGIGTTIFYIAGGILIIGAAVLLINRKKTNNA